MSEVRPQDVAAAVERLSGMANHTPVFTSRTLNRLTGYEIYLKCENFQRAGSFKFRGAYNAISRLGSEQQRAGIVTHSSGNHAQGLALAANLLGIRATVVMPEDAPQIKREATKGYSAEIVSCKAADREAVAGELVAEHGYTLIHPYDDDRIIAGQGTAAWELFEEVGELDALFVPVGGGGLISGSALAAAALSPTCRVVGVEPEAGADANHSWREGRVHVLDDAPQTIADGLRTRFIGQRNLAIMRRYVADMTTVSDEQIIETVQFLWQRMKLVVEPSAAAALAPVFSGTYASSGRRIGVILSGGNVDPSTIGWSAGSLDAPADSRPQRVRSEAVPSERHRILVCCPVSSSGLKILQEIALVDVKPGIGEEALREIVPGYHALVVDDRSPVSGQVIEYGFDLRVIASLGSGLDNIDVSAARALGVEIIFNPTSRAVAVAEHTLSLMLALTSQSSQGKKLETGEGLAGKTLALIGFGRIGRQVAQRALAFNMRVIVNQPRLTPELALAAGVEVGDLPELLSKADFVSLHVPVTRETEALIGQAELALLKQTAYLINTAHTDLVDDQALLAALEQDRLAGAALAVYAPPGANRASAPSEAVRKHALVMPARHVTDFPQAEPAHGLDSLARRVVETLRTARPSESLSLDVIPVEQVFPHEEIDEKRVYRLMSRLEADGRLVNPPIVTLWQGKHVILDGATRFTALERLGYRYVIAQVVPTESHQYSLHTWYHAISGDRSASELLGLLGSVEGLALTRLGDQRIQDAFSDESALCYFLSRAGEATLVKAEPGRERMETLRSMVGAYTKWGKVERTLSSNPARLAGQFPQLVAVAVFPQFSPDTVFSLASRGDRLPAGLTRFVIPGRILRLNADLERLKSEEPLQAKRAWLNRYLGRKLARSRLRYYQEPVVLLEE